MFFLYHIKAVCEEKNRHHNICRKHFHAAGKKEKQCIYNMDRSKSDDGRPVYNTAGKETVSIHQGIYIMPEIVRSFPLIYHE